MYKLNNEKQIIREIERNFFPIITRIVSFHYSSELMCVTYIYILKKKILHCNKSIVIQAIQ